MMIAAAAQEETATDAVPPWGFRRIKVQRSYPNRNIEACRQRVTEMRNSGRESQIAERFDQQWSCAWQIDRTDFMIWYPKGYGVRVPPFAFRNLEQSCSSVFHVPSSRLVFQFWFLVSGSNFQVLGSRPSQDYATRSP
jgi:hypothetical protein